MAIKLEGCDNLEKACQIISDEWLLLHEADVVPQKPKTQKTNNGTIPSVNPNYLANMCEIHSIEFTDNQDGTVTIGGNIYSTYFEAEKKILELNDFSISKSNEILINNF